MNKIPIPYVTKLIEMIDHFNNNPSYFVTFLLIENKKVARQTTIPWCRFREEDQDDIIVARSCDCNGVRCGIPTKRYLIPKNQLQEYVFFDMANDLHYVFAFNSSNGNDTSNPSPYEELLC